MSSDFTAAERAALDRATVPAMRATLAADIVSAAVAGGAGKLPPRRAARSNWRRPGRLVAGASALLLVSAAAAAATGLLEKLPIAIPGITRFAAAPVAAKPKHVVRAAKPRIVPARPMAVAAVQPPAPMPAPTPMTWRERRAARIAAGLPVRPLNARPRMRKVIARLRALQPEQRKVVVARYLEKHPRLAERLAERRIDPTTDQGVRRLQRIERLRAWRARREAREGFVAPVR